MVNECGGTKGHALLSAIQARHHPAGIEENRGCGVICAARRHAVIKGQQQINNQRSRVGTQEHCCQRLNHAHTSALTLKPREKFV